MVFTVTPIMFLFALIALIASILVAWTYAKPGKKWLANL